MDEGGLLFDVDGAEAFVGLRGEMGRGGGGASFGKV
jgi:hypothetical protein